MRDGKLNFDFGRNRDVDIRYDFFSFDRIVRVTHTLILNNNSKPFHKYVHLKLLFITVLDERTRRFKRSKRSDRLTFGTGIE